MEWKKILNNFVLIFFVCTTCIYIGTVVIRMIFWPEESMSYVQLLTPPVFGIVFGLMGIIYYSPEELSVKQILLRHMIYMGVSEIMILGLNYAGGALISAAVTISIALSIPAIFGIVCMVMWLNDFHSAKVLNRELKKMQENIQAQKKSQF